MRKKNISYEITKLRKYLKQLRQEQEFSIRHVAKQCQLAPSYLAKVEAGNTFKTIGVETLIKLSKFFNIPAPAILKEAGYMEMAKAIVDKKYQSI